jgi:hypothetical protein
MAGATPVLTVPQAGALVIQTGLGAGSPTFLLNNTTTDGSVVDVDSAVDAASGEVVASWQSLESPGGLYVQGAAPTIGTPELTHGQRAPAAGARRTRQGAWSVRRLHAERDRRAAAQIWRRHGRPVSLAR